MHLSNINVWDAVVMKLGGKLRLLVKMTSSSFVSLPPVVHLRLILPTTLGLGLFVAQEMQISDPRHGTGDFVPQFYCDIILI